MSREIGFPNDENGFVLRKMLNNGDDLNLPRQIEFFFLFPEQSAAEEFVSKLSKTDELSPEMRFHDGEEKPWEVSVSKFMMPTHVGITELESTLTILAEFHDGSADGWGCFKTSRKH